MNEQPPPSTRSARGWLAVLILGLLAGIGMLAYPFLPVTQHTATYRWDGAGPVALPLSPYRPERLTVRLDCALTGDSPGTVLETVRAVDEGMQAARGTLNLTGGTLTMTLHGEQLLVPDLAGCRDLMVDIGTDAVTVSRDGVAVFTRAGDLRPAIDSLIADVGVRGVSAVVVADTQFDSSPTRLKIVLGSVSAALLAVALALAALLDRRTAVRLPLLAPPARTRRPWIDTTVVVLAIAFGVVAGGATDDDGFIAQIMRTRTMSGYLGNYVRWNNTPEAPFGWFYEVYSRWGAISMEPVWLRILPALLGLAAWVLLRHALAPRLVPRLTVWPRVSLAAGFTLLWLVFCNSLRPEIFFALGAGIVLKLVTRAVRRERLLPLLIASIVAGFTVGTGPVGLVAVAPFVFAGRRLWQWLRPTPLRGLAAATCALAGLGSVVLAMFADQTWASVASANHARTEFGPIYPIWEDFQRYWKLWWSFAARQFSVYLSVVALGVLLWQWRRRSLPGIDRRIAGQVIGMAVALVVVMLLAPTKLPHHFGALLLVGPLAMAAVTHLLGRVTDRSGGMGAVARIAPGAVALALGGSVVALGLAAHEDNTWWKLSTLGLLLDKNPLAMGPVPLWPFLVVAGLALAWWVRRLVRAGRLTRWTVLAYAVALVLLSGFQYANFAQAALVRGSERYTLTSAAVAAVTHHGCKLERSLHYEPEPAEGVLPTPGPDPFVTRVTSGLRAWVAAADQPDRVETGWYALPAEVRSGRWPLVIGVSGADAAHRVAIEYNTGERRALTPTRKTLGTSDFSDIRLHPAATVTRFRLIAESDGPAAVEPDTGNATAFAVAQPRVPVTRPLLELARAETVAVAWNLAFFAPCLDTPREAHGRVEIADYILSDSQQPGNMSYHSGSGGPFAGVLGLTVPSRVPVYAAYDYTESEMSALDLIRLVPEYGTDLVAVERGTRLRGGLAAVPVIP